MPALELLAEESLSKHCGTKKIKWLKKKSDSNPIISGFKPRQKILRIMYSSDKQYYVSGHEIFDPEYEHSCTGRNGGRVPLSPKSHPKADEILIISSGQKGRPIPIKLSEVLSMDAVPSSKIISFHDLFKVANQGGVSLTGVVISGEKEDLSFGLATAMEPADNVLKIIDS